MRPFAKILLILLMLSLLAGCVSPRTPALRCTVLFEDNPDLIMSDQVWEIRQNTSLSVSIGVPSGQRIDTVSYGSYSLSAKTGSSEHYDYYTLTLHQVRYSTVIRITTAPAYTTGYHFPECSIAGITVLEESPHLFFNTLAWNSGYTRDGYVPIGWNTQPDGSGEAVGFGSRIDHRELSHMDLYIQWRSATPAQDLTWEQRGDGVYITGYRGQGDVVIPQTINGLTVTGIAAGAFPELTVQTLILPPTLQAVEAGAFGRVQAEDFYFFDSLCHLSEESFGSYCFTRIHIQAATAPVYSGSYF